MAGLPISILIYLILYAWIFLNASKLLNFISKHSVFLFAAAFVVIHVPAVYLYHEGIFHSHRALSLALSVLTSLSSMAFLLKLFNSMKPSKTVTFVSAISYEIYLVHMLFLGHFSVYQIANKPVGYLLLVVFSICAGVLIWYPSQWISKRWLSRKAS